MKLYVSTDMEGIAGIVRQSQLIPEEKDYRTACQLLLGEVNAVIEGALDMGVTDILVADMHYMGFNLPLEALHPNARYIFGVHWPRFPHIEKYDAMILLGYHAMAGTLAAVRDHTMSTTHWHDFSINGIKMGEVGFDAALAGYYGVPVIMVTGDEAVCKEASTFINGVCTVAVKEGLNRNSALTLSPSRARDEIRKATKEAISKAKIIRPLIVDSPVEIAITYNISEQADAVKVDGIHKIRLDGRTIVYRGKDVIEAMTLL